MTTKPTSLLSGAGTCARALNRRTKTKTAGAQSALRIAAEFCQGQNSTIPCPKFPQSGNFAVIRSAGTDNAARGIDVIAKQQIFQIIWEQSRKGISSIMVSSELEELLEVCHRILIMRYGRITGEVLPEKTTPETLYSLCMGGE